MHEYSLKSQGPIYSIHQNFSPPPSFHVMQTLLKPAGILTFFPPSVLNGLIKSLTTASFAIRMVFKLLISV
jgi:hypothetical protein